MSSYERPGRPPLACPAKGWRLYGVRMSRRIRYFGDNAANDIGSEHAAVSIVTGSTPRCRHTPCRPIQPGRMRSTASIALRFSSEEEVARVHSQVHSAHDPAQHLGESRNEAKSCARIAVGRHGTARHAPGT